MLSEFLGKELFDLKNDTWVNLALTDKDWTYIARLRAANGHRFDRSYLNLTLNYIAANADRVRAMYNAEAAVSRLLLSEGPDAADLHQQTLDKKDQQSLFSFRLACALHHSAKDELVAYFSGIHYSAWMRKRFLYPFVYFFINRPPDDFIDHHLSHLLPPGYENAQERAVIEFLLKDELAYDASFSFKCYVALTVHPYDACEILLNHCEATYAKNGMLGELERRAIEAVIDVVPTSRSELLPALFGKENCLREFRSDIQQDIESCFPKEEFGGAIDSLLGTAVTDGRQPHSLNQFVRAAAQLRLKHYPHVFDYEIVVSFARAYWFTGAGRVLGAYLTSLYLLPRRERPFELRELFRLAGFCGGITPLVATAPRGFQHVVTKIPNLSPSALTDHVALLNSPRGTRSDRVWLNQVHFELSSLEHAGHFRPWLQRVFESLPVMPGYLTGIDWSWFAEMVRLVRIEPFRSPAGIYALLLQYVEGRRKETNTLRIAVEPAAKAAGGLDSFLKWCFRSFGDKAVPLVRYFLTADMLLWLQLESNYVAALSSRMRCIEMCAREFGFGPLLSEETIVQEQKAYTAALLAINVGANQFEISWDILKKDVALAQGDVYNAYLAFREDDDSSAILTLAKQETDYYFAIGQRARYLIVNRDWPLFSVIAGIIDTFMEHPAQGIESLLAIRIRHNTLRREYLAAVAQINRANIPNVSGADREYIVPKFEATVGRVVQEWVDKYMHQKRPNKVHAVFDFVPGQEDLDGLLDSCRNHSEHGRTFDEVSRWIKMRLDAQLQTARSLLSKELRATLQTEIENRIVTLQIEEPYIHSIREIGRVLVAALNQQTDKLMEWFAMPSVTGTNVAIDDLHLAVCERFQTEIDGGTLALGRPTGRHAPLILKDNVRMVYDLWCEGVLNAVKHSGLMVSRVRISSYRNSRFSGLMISSKRACLDKAEQDVAGHPYTSVHDALFRDVESGLAKIASLSASVVGDAVVVRAVKRPRFFHLVVPLVRLNPVLVI